MGKSNSSNSKGFWKGGFGIVLPMMRKLLNKTILSSPSSSSLSASSSHYSSRKGVKRGHFVVIATQGWKPERFYIELGYLDDPEFVKLLKQAEEEFGFSQVGALAIPCEPDELKRIIGRKKHINNNKGINITC
ncbi:auxin-induced protein X10A-like [Cicer arietinum]|uniref:Auxin-induced protein X10A-like n=1 Tax=Cicer arietinum TaxID=3827 RepID=A0A1S2XU50_CICAR|nr:auxin-induced protein X10A-like [Cicer arietinum]